MNFGGQKMVNLNSREVRNAILMIIDNYTWQKHGKDNFLKLKDIKYDQKNWMLKIDNQNWFCYDRQCHFIYKKDYLYATFQFLESFKNSLIKGHFNKHLTNI